MQQLANGQVARRVPLLLRDWTLQYRGMLIPDRPLDFKRHPYLLGLYDCSAREMVVHKASQMGASEYLLSYAIHACDQRRATALYVFPTEGHVSDFSSARLGPAIEASPYLSELIIDGGGEGGRRGADRVTLKRIRDRFIYFRGGKVDDRGMAAQLKSIDADVLILDEVDEMDPRAPTIARKRLGASALAEERWVSTPTYPGTGIHAEWMLSDQREWHVRCEKCGEWQPMTMHSIVTEWDSLDRPARWHGQEDGRAFAVCRSCGAELDRLQPGEWVATYPTRDIAGFHLTKLFSPAANLLDLVKALQTTDETKMREAWNQDLGETYSPRGLKVSDEVIDACRREYAHASVKPAGTTVVAGIDVGGVLHCVIRGLDVETGERMQLWAGMLTWDDVKPTLDRFGVDTVVIDALPETTKARELQGKFKRGTVWLSYYDADTKIPDPVSFSVEKGVALLDRTRSLDATFALFFDQINTLPSGIKGMRFLVDYYPHLKASVRTIETKKNGEQVARYVETGPDHFAHAENYCAAARFINTKYAVAPGWAEYAREQLKKSRQPQADTNEVNEVNNA